MREALRQTQASSSQQWSDTYWESTSVRREQVNIAMFNIFFNDNF